MRKTILLLLVLCCFTVSYSQIKRSEKLVAISGNKYYLHKVELKQTMYSISKAYKVSINAILKANHKKTVDLREGELLKIPYSAPATIVQNLRYRYYIVKKNDTLFSLAKKFHTTQQELITLNAGVEVALVEGRRLIVPLATEAQPRYDQDYYYHIVNNKETFSAIARRYGMSLRKLKKANKELDPDRISPKDEVKIPIENARAEVARIRMINRNTKGEKEVLIVDDLSEKKKGTFIEIPEGWIPSTVSGEQKGDGYEIESSLFYEGNFKNAYKMLVFLPLKNSFSGMLDYYKGMRLAMQENPTVPVHIKVYDSHKSSNVVRKHLRKNKDIDFIVGPYIKQVFPAALDFSSENTTLVSLLSKNEEVYRNENIFQVNTTERSINYKIAKYVLTEHPSDNIVFFNGNTFKKYKSPDTLKIKHLADLINGYRSGGSADIKSYRENFEKLLNKDKKNIVIVPETNHIRVNNILSALNIFSMHDIEVIGYYKWKLLLNIEPEILFNLNVTYFTPFHYLPTEQEHFVEAYKSLFSTYPNDFSYMGYQTMQTLLKGIQESGKDFYKKPLQQIQKHKGGGYENINLHKVQFTDDFKIISD